MTWANIPIYRTTRGTTFHVVLCESKNSTGGEEDRRLLESHKVKKSDGIGRILYLYYNNLTNCT